MSVKEVLSRIEKQHGEGSVFKLGDRKSLKVEAISSGSPSLDQAMGVGGFPRGRVVEIFGPESSGKTTLLLGLIAQAQKLGGKAAVVDAEHALDPAWCQTLGVNTDDLVVSQPDHGEQALEITRTLVQSGEFDVVGVDSVAALVPKAELEGEVGDPQMGLQARMMSQALRQLVGITAKSRCILVFINQLREKIGVFYGNPETTTGGRALKFYASIRLDVRRSEWIKDKDQVIGVRAKVKVVKNKVATPFRVAEFDLIYGKGLNRAGEVLDLAVKVGVVEKSGSWFSFAGERLGQGRESVVHFLDESPETLAKIESKLKEVGK